jgi:CDP-glucose 4,6-dehydratase
LITGAQGFIGSWLAARLLDDGARVVVSRREARAGSRYLVDGLDQRCDAVDADLSAVGPLVRVLRDRGVRAVFHLAGRSTVASAAEDPLATFDANVRGTWTLLEACRRAVEAGAPVERVVVASSSMAHVASDSSYAVSKACAEAVARSYAHEYALPVAALRLANVYGGGDLNYTRLVPETARALVRGERPVLRTDGSPERDFLYVEDAVDAYLAVAASLDSPGERGRAWDGGTGEAVSVIDVVRRLIAVAGQDVQPRVDAVATAPADGDGPAPDDAALRDELGWRPRWRLDQGLAETYRWYERQLRYA